MPTCKYLCDWQYRCNTWTSYVIWCVSYAVNKQVPPTAASVSSRGSGVSVRSISHSSSGHTATSAVGPRPTRPYRRPPLPPTWPLRSRLRPPRASGASPSSIVRGRVRGLSPSPSRFLVVLRDASSRSSKIMVVIISSIIVIIIVIIGTYYNCLDVIPTRSCD